MHTAVHAPQGLLVTGLLLLLLPGTALGTDSELQNNTKIVGFLVFLLLLLLLVLALAWHKLSHDSNGKYHPRRLCHPRRLLRALTRRWHELQGQVPPERQWQGKEEDEDEEDEDEEDEEDLETLKRDEEEGKGGQEQQKQDDTDVSEVTPSSHPPDEALEEAEEVGCTSGGGLLSDLHSFSGTASWEDNAAENGSRQNVTAL